MGKHRRPRASWRKRQGATRQDVGGQDAGRHGIGRHGRETGRWTRRTVLTTAALGSVGAIVVGAGPFAGAGTANADEMTAEPVCGAGLFDVDPDQGSISQDPDSAVNGDVSMFPEDWGF